MTGLDRLRWSAGKAERRILGLMSGTSLDGVDAALVRFSGSGRDTRLMVEAQHTFPIPPQLRERVLALCHGAGNAEEVSRVNWLLGALFANAATALLDRAGVPASDIDAVASHGQTISHTAPDATLQIGESAAIAHRLGVPVLSDFRTADMAAGGLGAPLVPYADWCLLTHPTRARAIQNIGGIGNVTFLPPDCAADDVLGFDTGPGNMLIDRAVEWATQAGNGLSADLEGVSLRYDPAGGFAAAGEVRADLLEWLMSHPFLALSPPKSAGREEFGEAYFARALHEAGAEPTDARAARNVIATLTAFTAHSIASAYRRHLPSPPDEVILGGGGARNPTLVRMLAELLNPISVLTHEDVGINSDSKEAVSFALFANETLLGSPSNVPSVTGASRPVVLGKWSLP